MAAPALVLLHQVLLGEGRVSNLEIAIALGTSLALFVALARSTARRESSPIETEPDAMLPADLPLEALDVTPPGAPLTAPLWRAVAAGRRPEVTARAPIERVPAPGASRPDPSDLPADLEGVTYRASVLLACGDAAAGRRLASFLNLLGCEVEAVDSRAAVVRAFSGHRFDLVALDCDSATVEGFEAARDIRDDEARCFAHPPVPVIGLMAGAGLVDPERRLSAGLSELLDPPAEHHQMAAVLHRWLPVRLRASAGSHAGEAAPGMASAGIDLPKASSW